MNIAAVILAAGRASRFDGGNKLLTHIGGRPLIRRVVEAVEAAPVGDIVVVTAADGDAILAAAGGGRWRGVVNVAAAKGLSSSLQAGLRALPAEADGAMIVLADMPGMTAPLLARLCHAFVQCNGQTIVFPQNDAGEQGNPVLWPRALFPALLSLSGDAGGKSVLQAHRELWAPVRVENSASFNDIDTRQDLERWVKDNS